MIKLCCGLCLWQLRHLDWLFTGQLFAVKMFSSKTADVALRFGTIGSAAIFIASYFLVATMGGAIGIWIAVLVARSTASSSVLSPNITGWSSCSQNR